MMNRNYIFLCLLLSVAFGHVAYAAGPTPPDVRAAKMKARNVPTPTEEQIQRIEAAAPDRAPAKPARPRKVLVWGHTWAHLPNPYAEKALEIVGYKTDGSLPSQRGLISASLRA